MTLIVVILYCRQTVNISSSETVSVGEVLEAEVKKGALNNNTSGMYVNTSDSAAFNIQTKVTCNQTGQVLNPNNECGELLLK